jgi:hypothetical protein
LNMAAPTAIGSFEGRCLSAMVKRVAKAF